jgi:hypothetical protein
MAVQRVIPDTAPQVTRTRSAVRPPPAPAPRREASIAEQIDHLPDDYQRAMFCREQAEDYRRQWFAGREREIAYVQARAEARDPRFRRMTPEQLLRTAQWRWSQSARAQLLWTLESTFSGWAKMYLSFARHDPHR